MFLAGILYERSQHCLVNASSIESVQTVMCDDMIEEIVWDDVA